MSSLNDDELSSLLEQAKNKLPEPSPELAARAMRAYLANVAKPPKWRRLLLRPVPIPLPLGILAAVFLVVIGAVGGRSFWRASAVLQTRIVEVPVTRERVVYRDVCRDCPSGPQESSPAVASLTFKEFQPVRQIRPRVIRSNRNDQ
jgi:hypothetical protein